MEYDSRMGGSYFDKWKSEIVVFWGFHMLIFTAFDKVSAAWWIAWVFKLKTHLWRKLHLYTIDSKISIFFDKK
jgi:hypothetical protein